MKINLMIFVLVDVALKFNVAQSGFSWVSWNSGSENFPPKSLIGGLSPEGKSLYVARAHKNNSENINEHLYGNCVGDEGKSLNDCFVTLETKEVQVYDVKILTGENFVWCPKSGSVIDNLFPICRAPYHPGSLEVGTWLVNNKCRIGYTDKNTKNGAALKDDFEILKLGNC